MRILLCLLLLTAPALAADVPAEAKVHLDEGNKHFHLGAFYKAAEEYKLAYRALPHPSFLYNTAQSLRLAHEFADALFFYRSFLSADPKTTMRKAVEARIVSLERELASQKQAALDPPTGTVNPQMPSEPAVEEPAVYGPPVVPQKSDWVNVDITDDEPAPAPQPKKRRLWWPWAVAGAAVVAGVALGVGLGVGLDHGPKADTSFHF